RPTTAARVRRCAAAAGSGRRSRRCRAPPPPPARRTPPAPGARTAPRTPCSRSSAALPRRFLLTRSSAAPSLPLAPGGPRAAPVASASARDPGAPISRGSYRRPGHAGAAARRPVRPPPPRPVARPYRWALPGGAHRHPGRLGSRSSRARSWTDRSRVATSVPCRGRWRESLARPRPRRSGLRHHRVAQRAQTLDLHRDRVARLHRADALRRAGEDHVAGLQRGEPGDVLDQERDAEDQVLGAPVLAALAVHRARDADVGRVELGVHPRPDRAERVEALAAGPLAVGALDVARGHVVAAGV